MGFFGFKRKKNGQKGKQKQKQPAESDAMTANMSGIGAAEVKKENLASLQASRNKNAGTREELLAVDADVEKACRANEKEDTGSFVIPKGSTTWRASGYTATEPEDDMDYFSPLAYGPRSENGASFDYRPDKVVSVMIPCIDESDKELQNTIRSLYRQQLPTGYRVEAVIVIDGVSCLSNSMTDVLANSFGIQFKSGDETTDPFLALPTAETIVLAPVTQTEARARVPVVEGSSGGYALVVKRRTRRKSNSQQWWLAAHASQIGCQYAMALDCGTILEPTALARMIRRLESDSGLQAVSANQRVMTSEQQGDGDMECCRDFTSFGLRQLQRFENEIDQVCYRYVHDSLGTMHSLPTTCDLYRYKSLGSMSHGIMYNCFKVFQRSSEGLLIGNVKLVEDRIPMTLLGLPPKESSKFSSVQPDEGWWRTGFAPDAVCHSQAEKPLEMLMQQRRRRDNGALAMKLWMLWEGLITNSNKHPVTKILSWILVVIDVLQSLMARLVGPALLIAFAFRFGLLLPTFWADPSSMVDPSVNVEDSETSWVCGIVAAGLYASLYVTFVLAHTTPANDKGEGNGYIEQSALGRGDQSAFRPMVFCVAMAVNYVAVLFYAIRVACMVAMNGLEVTLLPIYFGILLCCAPFLLSFLNGLLHRDMRGLYLMAISAPVAMPNSVFSAIWVPAYSASRLGDLTWGNRPGTEGSENPTNAKKGAALSMHLLVVNILAAIAFAGLTLARPSVLGTVVWVVLFSISITFLVSLLDITFRMFTCQPCRAGRSDGALIETDEPVESYSGNSQPTPAATSYTAMSDPVKNQRSSPDGSDSDTDTSHFSDDDDDVYLQMVDGENYNGIAMVSLGNPIRKKKKNKSLSITEDQVVENDEAVRMNSQSNISVTIG